MTKRLALIFALALGGFACGDDDGSTDAATDTSTTEDTGTEDTGTEDSGGEDAGGEDAGGEDAGEEDGGGEAMKCDSNADCPDEMRCEAECGEEQCDCEVGERGEGAMGDLCESANDCASAICSDGTTDDMFRCTDVCDAPETCTNEFLPNCNVVGLCGR